MRTMDCACPGLSLLSFRQSEEVGEGTSPGLAMVSTAPGNDIWDPSWGVLGSGGCLGMSESWGRAARPGFLREPACLLLAQLPPPKALGLGFLSQLQIFLHCSVCLSCVSPSLGVLDFSDFFQLLMICETEQRVFGEAVHPHVECFQGTA